jgi:hypothetical protein
MRPVVIVAALALATAPAAAADFTFEIPVHITAIGAGTVGPSFQVGCVVSRARGPDGAAAVDGANVVAQGFTGQSLDRDGNFMGVIRLELNASRPEVMPASLGRYYTCTLRSVSVRLPAGTALSTSGSIFEDLYTRGTGQPITRAVWQVNGEIPPPS